MKNKWWENKAKEILQLADTHDMDRFFNATKAFYGPSTQWLTTLISMDGANLLNNKSINARWKEYFENLLNHDFS